MFCLFFVPLARAQHPAYFFRLLYKLKGLSMPVALWRVVHKGKWRDLHVNALETKSNKVSGRCGGSPFLFEFKIFKSLRSFCNFVTTSALLVKKKTDLLV